MLNAHAIGRIAIMQQRPQRYVERRTEELSYHDDRRCHVVVRQQIVIPNHGEEPPGTRRLIVPVGYFAKRLIADLKVYDDSGRELPVLNREDRGQAVALLFTSAYQRPFLSGLSQTDITRARVLWRFIQHKVARVATNDEDDALADIGELRKRTSKWANNGGLSPALSARCRELHRGTTFWPGLNRLAATRLILVEADAALEQPFVVRLEYSEPFEHEANVRRWQRALLWLGWEPTRVSRSTANYGQAASLWISQRVPSGVEPIRCFWSDRGDVAAVPAHHELDRERAVVNAYEQRPPRLDAQPPALRLDVQIAPSAAIAAAWALALLLLFVSTYVYQAPKLFTDPSGGSAAQQSFVGLAGAFAAVPAALAGALAYNGQAFARQMTRGPKFLLALLAAIASFLAVVVGLQRDPELITIASYVLSLYSLAMVGVFGYLQFGPRWRKGVTSRRQRHTAAMSPLACRIKQHAWARAFLWVWVAGLVIFARTQFELRYAHFFTDEFPLNIWRAFWSAVHMAHFDRGSPR